MDALMGFLEKKSTQLVPDLEFFAPIGEPPAPPDKHRMLKRVEPVDVTEVNQTTVSLARKNIEGEIMTYLNTTDPDYMLLVRAAAGVGKTWLGVAAANWVATTLSRRVFYAGARHDFYQKCWICSQQPLASALLLSTGSHSLLLGLP